MTAGHELFRQHLIDPQRCTRCNACQVACPIGAITHDARNYAVDPNKCNFCGTCMPTCSTGAVRNWRVIPRAAMYPVVDQLKWDALPPELSLDQLEALQTSFNAAP